MPDALDLWTTERYRLLNRRGKQDIEGIVEHAPWLHRELSIQNLHDEFSSLIGENLRMRSLIRATYARVLDVRFRPFRRLP